MHCSNASREASACAHRSIRRPNVAIGALMTAAGELAHPTMRRAGAWLLVFGVIYPAAVIAFELVTRLCAMALFDPMPTPAHIALVSAVPAINLWLWLRLRRGKASGLAVIAGGAAAMVALSYSIIFLPLYPLSLVAILFYGLGLAPFAPLSALIAGALMTARAAAQSPNRSRKAASWSGPILGLALIAALDAPQAATRLALEMANTHDRASEQRALAIMRTIGDRDLLLRLCYDATGRPSGPVSALVAGLGGRFFSGGATGVSSTAAARILYYRLTGDPFNAVRPPFNTGAWSFAREFEFDEDQGGSIVGQRVRGVSLAASRIDGSISADDGVGYLEWTLEFSNSGDRDSEARASIVLPPGGFVSRASLWVAGEEREAVFAGRAQVQEAYRQIVRIEQRDPLLVTTSGADRILVQAFPIPAGGTLRLRIGVTAPLDLSQSGQAALALPAIADRNFSIGAELRHEVWFEGDGAALSAPRGLQLQAPTPGVFRLRGAFTDAALSGTRPRITARRTPAPSIAYTPARPLSGQPSRTANAELGPYIVQQIERRRISAPGAVVFLLDGSARARGGAEAIAAAVALLADGQNVGLITAEDNPVLIEPAPLDADRRRRIAEALSRVRFHGGQDNTGPLADAIGAAEPHADATVVWVHGPQPVLFWRDAARLEQALARSTRLPRLVLYPIASGPNQLLGDHPWFWRARTLARSGDPAADLTRLAVTLRDHVQWEAETAPAAVPPASARRGSDHIARLWAYQRSVDRASTSQPADLDAAVALAQAYQVVTPVSGAVVLETDADYERTGLEPPVAGDVPTVPEPEVYLLLLVACAMLCWFAWRRNRMVAA